MSYKSRLYPFSSLLQNVPMLNFFDRFLQENFSGENLSFWFEVESYKSLSPEKMPEKARDLYNRYMKPGSVSEVNVDCELKTECKHAIEKNITPSLFSQAQQAIYEVMQTDSYPKFLRSDIYQQYLQEHNAPSLEDGEEDRTPLIPCPWTWFCHKVPTPKMKIQSMCVSPSPHKVWTAISDGRIVTWRSSVQALNAEKLQEIQAHQKRINAITYLQQKVWAASDDSTLSVWDSESESELVRIETEAEQYPLLAVLPNKRENVVFVGSAGGHIYAFDSNNYTKLFETKIEGPAICFCDDGEHLWVGSDHMIHLFNNENLSPITSFHAHDRSVKMIVASLERFWTCSDNDEIFVWTKTGKEVAKLAELKKHEGRVTTLCPVQDTVWSGSFDKTIIVWDAQTFQFLQQHVGQHSDSVRCMTQVSDGVVWVASFDRHMSIWHYYDHSQHLPHG